MPTPTRIEVKAEPHFTLAEFDDSRKIAEKLADKFGVRFLHVDGPYGGYWVSYDTEFKPKSVNVFARIFEPRGDQPWTFPLQQLTTAGWSVALDLNTSPNPIPFSLVVWFKDGLYTAPLRLSELFPKVGYLVGRRDEVAERPLLVVHVNNFRKLEFKDASADTRDGTAADGVRK